MLKHRNDAACPANGFYTYSAFVAAARFLSGGFVDDGTDVDTRKQGDRGCISCSSTCCNEIARGGSRRRCAETEPFAWRLLFQARIRGYSGNYNYGPAGQAIGADLLGNPDLVATDPTISFKTAIWFWMTPQSPKPSCHAVITGQWTPSSVDQAAGRAPGFGVITNIINGGLECGKGSDARVADRIGFYKRYCDLLGVGYGPNLDCYSQSPFA
ncbi:Chitinase 12 [Acorus calamus]|uniref:chitinase n=1 Tax=Acorus calamus TaxID=4465 RepID=A0AAV9FKX4_ACOCL|nr:Chitinase 12 [Acorus calamus]